MAQKNNELITGAFLHSRYLPRQDQKWSLTRRLFDLLSTHAGARIKKGKGGKNWKILVKLSVWKRCPDELMKDIVKSSVGTGL